MMLIARDNYYHWPMHLYKRTLRYAIFTRNLLVNTVNQRK